MTKDVSLEVDYVHSIGKDEIHRWHINTARNLNTDSRLPACSRRSTGRTTSKATAATPSSTACMSRARCEGARASVMSSYSWSKGMNIGNDFGSLSADLTNTDWEMDWGPMPNDIRHRVTTGAVFQLPRGFQVSTSFQANTGKPINPLGRSDRCEGGGSTDRSRDG